ncbi:MAG: DNA-directed RNA polymerase subunit D [Candidatus Freyarchaeota archaeon]|jgi:DNA-directed RNA polymerase subunit D
MNIRILSKDTNNLRFLLENVDVAFANALRRIILAEVPTMAIEEVIIIENTSPLFDEILAHRLGLIPLKTDLENYVLPEECSCQGAGCTQCQLTFTLEREAEEEGVTVYSGDLKSQDPSVVPVSDKIPIVRLARGQRIVLEAYASLGQGKDHAKYQPVSTCAYKYKPIVQLEGDKCEACGECVTICPKGVLDLKNKSIVIKDVLNCSLCKSCEEKCEFDAIHVDADDSSFIFSIESTGALPPEKIVETAIEIFEKKVKQLQSLLA